MLVFLSVYVGHWPSEPSASQIVFPEASSRLHGPNELKSQSVLLHKWVVVVDVVVVVVVVDAVVVVVVDVRLVVVVDAVVVVAVVVKLNSSKSLGQSPFSFTLTHTFKLPSFAYMQAPDVVPKHPSGHGWNS